MCIKCDVGWLQTSQAPPCTRIQLVSVLHGTLLFQYSLLATSWHDSVSIVIAAESCRVSLRMFAEVAYHAVYGTFEWFQPQLSVLHQLAAKCAPTLLMSSDHI